MTEKEIAAAAHQQAMASFLLEGYDLYGYCPSPDATAFSQQVAQEQKWL